MKRHRIIYHVKHNASNCSWFVTSESDENLRDELATKEEAVRIARLRAREEPPSQMRVYKRDGSFDYESSYGNAESRVPQMA